jgi:hypothetical protein
VESLTCRRGNIRAQARAPTTTDVFKAIAEERGREIIGVLNDGREWGQRCRGGSDGASVGSGTMLVLLPKCPGGSFHSTKRPDNSRLSSWSCWCKGLGVGASLFARLSVCQPSSAQRLYWDAG